MSRRLPGSVRATLACAVAAPLLLGALFSAAMSAARADDRAVHATTPRPAVAAVESVALVVSDLDASVRFFHDALDFQEVSRAELAGADVEHLEGVFATRLLTATLALGDERLELREFLAPEGRPIPADARSNDLAFQHVAIVVSDMERAYARLRTFKVRHASSGPQVLPAWNPNAGGIAAFYFKDRDGHVLEVIHFPPGKGDPRWNDPAVARERLFLGIDHTAIVVRDTDASLALYRDALGMRVAGESENYGDEQEHLNGVFGARLRITGLRAAAGPGIEFLEYLAPSDGRAAPADTRACDLWAWRTRLRLADPADAKLLAAVRAAGARLVSAGTAVLDEEHQGTLGMRAGTHARDVDGHALLLAEGSGTP